MTLQGSAFRTILIALPQRAELRPGTVWAYRELLYFLIWKQLMLERWHAAARKVVR